MSLLFAGVGPVGGGGHGPLKFNISFSKTIVSRHISHEKGNEGLPKSTAQYCTQILRSNFPPVKWVCQSKGVVNIQRGVNNIE